MMLLSKLIYDNLSIGKPTVDFSKALDLPFLDLSKAFDSVDHKILLAKLYNVGIRGVCLSLIESYLHDRSQVVKINGTISQPVKVNIGVPQGSILGPLLFILYINDLLTIYPDLIAYADDTAVPMSESSWTRLAEIVSARLDGVFAWLHHNNLILNIKKSVYITFGNYVDSVPASIDVLINGNILKRVEYSKYLGVIYDHNIKWDIHVSNIIKKKNI